MSTASIGFSMILPDLLLAAGIALLSMLMLFSWRSKLAARNRERSHHDGRSGRGDTSSSPRASDAVRDELIALEAAARNTLAQIETRARTLEALIRHADQRIKALQETGPRNAPESISPSKLEPIASSPALPDVSRKQSQYQPKSSAHKNGSTPKAPSLQTKPPIVKTPEPSAPTPFATTLSQMPTPKPAAADPMITNVYELADRGISPVQIAQTLDEQIGKVELILALRQ